MHHQLKKSHQLEFEYSSFTLNFKLETPGFGENTSAILVNELRINFMI
jgi:hypothetical protein